ncbi:chondroitinase-B domain-containing protein [Flavivirga sp. 57AJ16]|uniref:chondroitinase-B domain-containing protein n=1 Tax=Flavivirga sp. 57AJ16 TaxID=3025307 RepID=UPI0023650943|nr:chondroitinase-B domain-containing protein [Flavivirga sp. 57AJ16]MDD7887512.1 chondroitinase-B domain-containing protein [Flavivirga sp. 57AJ16]
MEPFIKHTKPSLIRKTIYLICILSAIGSHGQTYVNTDSNLQNLVNSASPGEVFIVSDGSYNDFYCSFTANATADNPITIKAENVGGVTLTGDSHFVFKKAAHLILEGFVFDCTGNNTMVKLEGSNNIRITRNQFELHATASVKWVVVTGYYNDYTFQYLSHHNRIDHNKFQNKTTEGNFITIDGTYNEDHSVNQQSQYDLIDYNYFYNSAPRVVNGKEAIRVGNSQLSTTSGYTTVAYNLFEECDGDPEIVSVKSCDNIIRGNTFYRSYGTLTLRQGNRSLVEGNYFFGGGKANGNLDLQTLYTGGVRAYGTDHIIINNYFEGLEGTLFDAPITLTQGDAIDGVDTNYGLHFRGERITIAYNTLVNNTYGIEIGYAKSNGSYDKPLIDIILANNLVTGSQNSLIKIHNDQNGELLWNANLMYPTGSAVLNSDGYSFSSSEVVNSNPYLVEVGTLWQAGASTPLLGDGLSSLVVDEDIQGQPRPSTSNPGADHFSNDAIVYGTPVSSSDVGPYADEDSSLAIMENEFKNGMKIVPNPASEIFYLDSGAQKIEFITIHTLTGKQLIKFDYDETASIDVSNLPSGLYLVQIKTDTGKYYTQQLIIK